MKDNDAMKEKLKNDQKATKQTTKQNESHDRPKIEEKEVLNSKEEERRRKRKNTDSRRIERFDIVHARSHGSKENAQVPLSFNMRGLP